VVLIIIRFIISFISFIGIIIIIIASIIISGSSSSIMIIIVTSISIVITTIIIMCSFSLARALIPSLCTLRSLCRPCRSAETHIEYNTAQSTDSTGIETVQQVQ
jgi:hypothetical protein